MGEPSVNRSKVFVQTKVPGCANPAENTTRNPNTCYKDAKRNLETDLAKLGLRAMIAGTLAAFMTACVAGVLV